MKNKGFTLIELMIVVAIIAIIAAIAIPGLVRARISANEGSAVGTLRTLSTSQAQYQSQAQCDQDQDGAGEYGTLGELAGTTSRRGNQTTAALSTASPSFITSVLGPTAGTFQGKSGYNFEIFLPGTAAAVPTVDNGTTALAPLDPANATQQATINVQENQFRAYGWPISHRTTGIRCFAVDQAGEVLAAPNATPLYTSNTVVPFSAAVASTDADNADTFEGNFRGSTAGKDNQTWTAAGG